MTALVKNLRLHRGAVRKDSAACVSLSSYSLVKQPGSEEPPTLRRTEEPTKLRHPRTAGWRFTVPVRSFRGASSRRNAVAGADGSYIGGGPRRCQRESRKFFARHSAPANGPGALYEQTVSATAGAVQCRIEAIFLRPPNRELIRGVIAEGALPPSSRSLVRSTHDCVVDADMGVPAPGRVCGRAPFRLMNCAGGLRFGSQTSARQFAEQA
jgi:hypothetical protein